MSLQNVQNPYPGLRPFEQEDSDFFFGRESHTEELLRRLGSARFVAVVGTSGSGKSSLVRAGLLPALYGDMLAAGSHWSIAIFRPGDDPIKAMAGELHRKIPLSNGEGNDDFHRTMLETTLRRSSYGLLEAAAQAKLKERENLLLIVDQFEEVFRFQDQAANPSATDESAAFVKLLLEGTRNHEIPLFVLITMRSDFLGDCARFRDFPEAVNKGLYLIPRLTREELRKAIEGPAAVAGAKISPALVECLLNDVGDDQDQLPVLQHALMRTWRPNGDITLTDYEVTGGMAQALSNHADEALRELTEGRVDVARKMFQCLSIKGADNREVRRPTRFGDIPGICGATESAVREVIECFRAPGRSFLMPPHPEPIFPDTRIDISHESLIRKWETLRRWVNEEAESAEWYGRVARSAQLRAEGREGLWRDPALQFALEMKSKEKWNEGWGKRYDENYDAAIDFLEESRREREAESRAKEKQRRKELKRTRLFAAVLAVAFVLAALGALYAQRQQKLAEEQDRTNRQLLYVANMNLAYKAFEESNFSRVHELMNIYLPSPVTDKRSELRSFHWYYLWRLNHNELKTLKGHEDSVFSVAFSPDGKTLATGSVDHTVKLWDVSARQELATLKGHENVVRSVAFSPDGKTLATGSVDNTVKLWDVSTRRELATLKGHKNIVRSVAFSPDSKTLATGSEDHTVKLWDVGSRRELATLKGHKNIVRSVAFSPRRQDVSHGKCGSYRKAVGREQPSGACNAQGARELCQVSGFFP